MAVASAVGSNVGQGASAHRRDAAFRMKRPLQRELSAIRCEQIPQWDCVERVIRVGAPGSLVGTRRFCVRLGVLATRDA